MLLGERTWCRRSPKSINGLPTQWSDSNYISLQLTLTRDMSKIRVARATIGLGKGTGTTTVFPVDEDDYERGGPH